MPPKPLKTYRFGYNLDEIEQVMNYLYANYRNDVDYYMWIGMGDDVMNALEVFNPELLKDEMFLELIQNTRRRKK